MNTDEHGLGNGNGTLIGANGGHFAAKERRDRKGRKGRKRLKGVRCGSGGEPWRDPIALAFAREREARRVLRWPMEQDSVFFHVFRCECCGKIRPEEQRREPDSEVCVICVRAAGFG